MNVFAYGILITGFLAIGLMPASIGEVAPSVEPHITVTLENTAGPGQTDDMALAEGTDLASKDAMPSLDEDWIAPKESLTETLQRPLFSSTRRPPKADSGGDAIAATTIADEESIEANTAFALAGVVLDGENSVALLQNLDTQEYFHVRKGDVVEGWRIEAIKSKVVLMVKGDDVLGVLSPFSQSGQ